MKLASVLNISYSSNTTCEEVFTIKGILCHLEKVKLGRIPFFVDGGIVSSKVSTIKQLTACNAKFFKIQYNLDQTNGFEVCCSVQTFKSFAEFERSPYFRKGASYGSKKFPLLTEK